MTLMEVRATGALALVEDRGRVGLGHLGVGRSGAADRASYDLANRLVGNRAGAASVEATLGGLAVAFDSTVFVAVTGAPVEVRAGGRRHAVGSAFHVRAGEQLWLGVPRTGLRTYVAVRGGVLGTDILGSMSWDTMAHLGTPPLRPGDVLGVGDACEAFPATDLAPSWAWTDGVVELPLLLGPRHDWFTAEALDRLANECFTVSPDTDRVGARLSGPPLCRRRAGELASEGVVTGALQVPTEGRPTLFLADHPVTGGYPVVGAVPRRFVGVAAQLAPGRAVRFRVLPR